MERSIAGEAEGLSVAPSLGTARVAILRLQFVQRCSQLFARNGPLDQCKSLLARRLMVPLRRSPNTQSPAITATHSANLRGPGGSDPVPELTAAE